MERTFYAESHQRLSAGAENPEKKRYLKDNLSYYFTIT